MRINGRKEVAAMGIASVIHQIAIHEVRASIVCASGLRSGEEIKK